MPVDVDSCWLSWSIVSFRGSVVADEWYNDTCASKLAVNVLHVHRIGERCNGFCRLCVFVLGLDEDDRSAVRY
jgi:hypothetical protein